ncbi:MAG TPA: bifunctional precorrin-2 dehydrogenase/sirohydrochlorin ferrochelatase [Methanocella sp.]|nr:bifunctional precorrin-2 dehydrogenase/sirohydrochlorin ferrochelatase [Methanocella sp.]
MSDYLPLFIGFTGRRVVIFGGGVVGERKARYFAGVSDVLVVSPEFTPGLEAMGGVSLVRETVALAGIGMHVSGAFLVVAATGDHDLNREIVRVCGERGVLANSADGGSDVILPSMICRGDISIAIATGGKSPAMSKYLRQRLESVLSEDLANMVRLQADVRGVLKRVVPEQKDRERLLWEVLNTPAVWEAMKTSYEAALTLALKKVEGREP